jgi:hypothetical protein
MKTGTFLFAAIVALLGAALVFLGTGKSFVARPPSPQTQALPKENPELQKTEASLARLKKIRFAGVFLPEAPDRLLPSREAGNAPAAEAWNENGALFPVPAQSASGGGSAPANSARGWPGVGNAAGNAYANSARGRPALGNAAGNAYANSAGSRPATGNAAGNAYANSARSRPAPGNAAGNAYANSARGWPGAGNAAGNAYANSAGSGPAVVNPAGNADANSTAGAESAAAVETVNAVSLTYVSRGFRRAVVDGELVREGHRLPDGARVDQIARDSVVLMRDGKRIGVSVPKALFGHSTPTPEASGQP